MTTIKTTCSSCGDVELRSDDLTLELAGSEATGQYRFCCPYCERSQYRPANERVVAILLATGVPYVVSADVVTEAEIIEFVASLDAWLQDITAA